MVSSNKTFDSIDNWGRHPSTHSPFRPSKVLWLADQQSFVDPLIKKIDELFGDTVIRLPSEKFDEPQELATKVLDTAQTAQISEIVIIGHPHFQSCQHLCQVDNQPDENNSTETFTSRLFRKQQRNQFAKQKLLEITNNLICICDERQYDLLISPLYYRAEDNVVCYFNTETNRFEAIQGGSMR